MSNKQKYIKFYEEIDPYMEKLGFMKKNHRYYRLYGDQIIQTVCRDTQMYEFHEDIIFSFSHPCMGIDYRINKNGKGFSTRLSKAENPNNRFPFEWGIEYGEMEVDLTRDRKEQLLESETLWIGRTAKPIIKAMDEYGISFLDSIKTLDDIYDRHFIYNKAEFGELEKTLFFCPPEELNSSVSLLLVYGDKKTADIQANNTVEYFEERRSLFTNAYGAEAAEKFLIKEVTQAREINDMLKRNDEKELAEHIIANEERAKRSIAKYLKFEI